jgi:hypothetical protein
VLRHLAGAVGVSVTEALIDRGLVTAEDGVFALASGGGGEFGRFGIEVDRWSGAPGHCCDPAWTGASAAITWPAAWAPP